jgi:peptidoglycan/LPS O-acetylase OafA/YrhL
MDETLGKISRKIPPFCPILVEVKTRLEHLDSLRGLAALTVVYSHFFLAYGFPASLAWALTNTPLHLFWDGFAAVSLFFVLSGYVLARKFLQAPSLQIGPRLYYFFSLSRIVRIWTPFAAVLGGSLAIRYFFPPVEGPDFQSSWYSSFWKTPETLRTLLDQIFLWDLAEPRLIPQAWSLQQELELSFLLPLAVLIVRRSSLALLGLTMAAIILLKLPMLGLHFTLGVLMARHEDKLRAWFPSASRQLPLLFAGLVLYTYRFSFAAWFPSHIAENRIWYITGFGSAGILATAIVANWMQRVLSHPWLIYLGRISYAVYLCHFTILLLLFPRLFNALSALGFGANSLRLIGFFVITAATIAGSELLYRTVDSQSIEWARKVFRRATL